MTMAQEIKLRHKLNAQVERINGEMNSIATAALLNAREILKQHGYTLFRCSLLKNTYHPSLEIIIDGQVTDVIAEETK